MEPISLLVSTETSGEPAQVFCTGSTLLRFTFCTAAQLLAVAGRYHSALLATSNYRASGGSYAREASYSGTGSRLMSNKGKSALFFICCLQNRLCSLQTVKMLWQHPYWTAYTVGGAKGADLDRMIISPWVLFSLYLSPSFCVESQKNTSSLLLNHRKLIVLLLMKASALLFQNFL